MTVLSNAPYTLAMLSATPSSLDLVPRTILYTPPSSLTRHYSQWLIWS